MHRNHQTLFVLICKVDEGKFDFILCQDEFFVVGFTNVVFRFGMVLCNFFFSGAKGSPF